jgi:hypothetical protein
MPRIVLWLEIPLFSVRSHFLRDSQERFTFDVVRFEIKVWKWGFEIDIYYPFQINL